MALADSLTAARKLMGQQCRIATVAAQLSASDQKTLSAALADFNIPAAQIARALKAEGHTLEAAGIARHRRGECVCGAR